MGKSAHRKSFLIHTDSLEILDDLTDEQAGQLFKAIKDYQFGNEPKLSQLIKIAFNPFKNYFERDNEKWESEIDKRREAGRLGAEARWGKDNKKSQVMASDGKGIAKMASAISANSKMANMADSVSVSVSVSDSENKKENFFKFWCNYPKKTDKKKAQVSFCRLSKTKQNKAIDDCGLRYIDTDKKYIPNATTYLNGERWEDEKEGDDDKNANFWGNLK